MNVTLGTPISVAPTALNTASAFWSQHIGKEGIVTNVASDGMWDVVISYKGLHISDVVVEGVLPDRFIILPPEPVFKRINRRMLGTYVIAGTIIAIIGAVALLHKMFP